MHQETDDKIVLISNFTEVLDLFERLLRKKKYVTHWPEPVVPKMRCSFCDSC